MKLLTVAALLFASASTPAQTVFKCTATGGQVTMQQTPCASSSTGSAKVYSSSSPAPAPGNSVAAAPAPRRQWIVWAGDPRQDAAKAVANLDAIRMLGQGCEARLRGRNTDLADCMSFLEQLAPGGDFGRIGDKLKELVADRSTAQQVGEAEFRRALRITEDVVRTKDFVLAALPRR